MEDITESILNFKEAIRHVWNTYFATSCAPMSPDIQNAFALIERGLFGAVVLSHFDLGERASEYRVHPLPFIVVRPEPHIKELFLQVFEKKSWGGSSLSEPLKVNVNEEMVINFFDFFDWRIYEKVDFPYVRACVTSLPGQPDLNGSMVLIEQQYCRFFIPKTYTM